MPKFHVTVRDTQSTYTTYEIEAESIDAIDDITAVEESGTIVETSIENESPEITEIEEDC